MDTPNVPGYVPEKYCHRRTQPEAMDAAYVRAVEYGERFWVTMDGEHGWYVCPVSERDKWLTSPASN